jgi:large subunit ribosomal protein L30
MAVDRARPKKKEKSQRKTAKKVSKDRFLKVKLVRSLIRQPQKQREVVRGLGLRKLQSETVCKDCPEIWGMIRKVEHLIRVEEVDKK